MNAAQNVDSKDDRLSAEFSAQIESAELGAQISPCYAQKHNDPAETRLSQLQKGPSVQDFIKGRQTNNDTCQKNESLFNSSKHVQTPLFHLVIPKLTMNPKFGAIPTKETATRQPMPTGLTPVNDVVPNSNSVTLLRASTADSCQPTRDFRAAVSENKDPAKRSRDETIFGSSQAKKTKIGFEISPRIQFPLSNLINKSVSNLAAYEKPSPERPDSPSGRFGPGVSPAAKTGTSAQNATAVAESMIMDLDHEESADDIQEQFVRQTGLLASAIEEMAGDINETAETMSQLALELLTANNEVLLMNASILRDEKVKMLEECAKRLLEE